MGAVESGGVDGGVMGLRIAGMAPSRPRARAIPRAGAWVLGALVAVPLVLVTSSLGRVAIAGLSGELLFGLAPFLALAFAVSMATAATRLRRRGEVLASCAPSGIDGAAAELESGGRPVVGIFSGRIGADGAVTSPSGTVCAFYGARVREVREPGRKGAIVSHQRAAGARLWIRGERAHASVAFSPSQVFAAEEARPGMSPGRFALDDGTTDRVVSHERVGRIGESCFALGRLEWGDAPGSCVIRGVAGGPAAILIGVSHAALGREWRLRSWVYFAGAAALTCAAAWLLAR
jgi:hypothetical protein